MTQTKQRYYWLKLQGNFFERAEIKVIDAMPNGKDYIIFYLKLMLTAMNASGKLMFQDTLPYTPELLSTVTNTNIDVVKVAIDTFIGLKLMEKLDDGALFIREVNKLLGSETEFAQKKREYREKTMSRQLEGKIETKKDIVRQEIDIEIEKETPYNPPNGDTGVLVQNCIKKHNYPFNNSQLNAINLWFNYKTVKNEKLDEQQIEFTLKHLNQYLVEKDDIIYLIENSIAKGYKGIMEPTHNSAKLTFKDVSRYPAKDYITPETKLDKINLCNYIERCYLRDSVDPRTRLSLTDTQKDLLKAHFKERQRIGLSITDYIYQKEVLTDICLLEQVIEPKYDSIRS